MARPKAVSLSTLNPEELQARCEELCFERPPVRAYNALIYGLDILHDIGVNGNLEPFKRIEHLAEEATRAGADFEKAKTNETNHFDVIIAGETLFEAAVNGNMEAYKRLVRLADEAIQAAADKDL